MYFCYIDDSGDEKVRVFSVVAIPIATWRVCFERIRDYRRKLKQEKGIFVTVEFHATEFVSGRGRISATPIGKYERCKIFNRTLTEVTQLPGARIFNAIGPKDKEAILYERLLNRINRTLVSWQSPGLLISDEGKDYTSLVRRMGVHNPIPSMFGGWPEGRTKNIVLGQIYEDPVFRKSHRSYFIQIADFCAYALLRSEYHLPSKNKYGLHHSFDLLRSICTPECFRADQRRLGIIRCG